MEARAVEAIPTLAYTRDPQADEGTRAHYYIAKVLSGMLDTNEGWSDVENACEKLGGKAHGMSAWTLASARRGVAYAVALYKRLSKLWDDLDVYIEQHLSGKRLGLMNGGTADLILVCRKGGQAQRVVIVDWKCGYLNQGVAADSIQLACYAWMAWNKWQRPAVVEIHLAQMRLRHYTATEYVGEMMEALQVSISDLTAKACGTKIDEIPYLSPSFSACQYCKAFVLCHAARLHVTSEREYIMDACEKAALLELTPKELLRLDEAIRLCRRFAEAGKNLQKQLCDARRDRK